MANRSPQIGVRSDAENLQIRRLLTWRADSWKELFDAMHSAEYVEWVAHETAEKSPGDCDDFAAWNAACARVKGYRTCIVMVGWHKGWKPNGHAVAVRIKGLRAQWCDYDEWTDFTDLPGLAKTIALRYGGDGATYYAALGEDLKVRSYGYAKG